MKIQLIKLATFIAVLSYIAGCNKTDDQFLAEVRRDGLTVDNALITKSQFDLALNACYRQVQVFYNSSDGWFDSWHLGANFDVSAIATVYIPDPTYPWVDYSKINSQDGQSATWWNWNYSIVKFANTVIGGVENKIATITADEKKVLLAEAKFFRAWAYRNLNIAFGGVPIITGPIAEAKVDFVRNTPAECNAFIKSDLESAVANLPIATPIKGKVVRAAADHLLAEINIILKDYDGAIAAATRVIGGTDGAYSLMKTRFGARRTEIINTRGVPTDYYWDLHEIDNQDYQTGNMESIWVAQFERNIQGGGVAHPTLGNRMNQGRVNWCRHWLFAKAGLNGVAADSIGRDPGTAQAAWRHP